MIDASFINTADNVPFRRVYRTRRGFTIALKKMKGIKFLFAMDRESSSIIYPEHVKLNKE